MLRRAAARRLAPLLLAGVLLAPGAGVAAAQSGGSPLSPIAPAQPTQTEPTVTAPTTTTTSTDDNGGLSRGTEILIAAAGALLLVVLAYAILRDARKRAPVQPGESLTEPSEAATRAPAQQRKARNRSKGKAAKAARRHNRPR